MGVRVAFVDETKTDDEDSSALADPQHERLLAELAEGRAKVEALARAFARALEESGIKIRDVARVWTKDALASGELHLDENGALQAKRWGSLAHFLRGHVETMDTVWAEKGVPVIPASPIETLVAMNAIGHLTPVVIGRAPAAALEEAKPYLQAALAAQGMPDNLLPIARLETALIAWIVARQWRDEDAVLDALADFLGNTGGVDPALARVFRRRDESKAILRRYRTPEGGYRVKFGASAKLGRGWVTALSLAGELLNPGAAHKARPSEIMKPRKTKRRMTPRE